METISEEDRKRITQWASDVDCLPDGECKPGNHIFDCACAGYEEGLIAGAEHERTLANQQLTEKDFRIRDLEVSLSLANQQMEEQKKLWTEGYDKLVDFNQRQLMEQKELCESNMDAMMVGVEELRAKIEDKGRIESQLLLRIEQDNQEIKREG